jgi:hypothetical protein
MNNQNILTLILILIIIVLTTSFFPIELFNNFEGYNVISNEAIQTLSNIYNSNKISASEINAIQSETSNRLNITGNDKLYLLNKGGVVVSKENNGNGQLIVDGNLIVNGKIFNKYSMAGAYLCNDRGQLPIFTSMPDLTDISTIPSVKDVFDYSNTDYMWIVMPGYKIYLCKNKNYDGIFSTVDNTNSDKPLIIFSKNLTVTTNDTNTSNLTKSVKLYLINSMI